MGVNTRRILLNYSGNTHIVVEFNQGWCFGEKGVMVSKQLRDATYALQIAGDRGKTAAFLSAAGGYQPFWRRFRREHQGADQPQYGSDT